MSSVFLLFNENKNTLHEKLILKVNTFLLLKDIALLNTQSYTCILNHLHVAYGNLHVWQAEI